MKQAVASATAIGCLLGSATLASAIMLTMGQNIPIGIILAISFLLLGAWGFYRRSPSLYIAALGGQMVWSIITLSLSGPPALALWALLFANVALVLIGNRGLWLNVHLTETSGPLNARAGRLLLKDMGTVAMWLGAAAAISAAFFVATPLLPMGSGGIALLMLLAVVALFSFTVLATRLGRLPVDKDKSGMRQR